MEIVRCINCNKKLAEAEFFRLSIKGKMIVSVNDIPAMREVFSGLVVESTDIDYTVGGGGRRKPARELIIRNF